MLLFYSTNKCTSLSPVPQCFYLNSFSKQSPVQKYILLLPPFCYQEVPLNFVIYFSKSNAQSFISFIIFICKYILENVFKYGVLLITKPLITTKKNFTLLLETNVNKPLFFEKHLSCPKRINGYCKNKPVIFSKFSKREEKDQYLNIQSSVITF